MPTLSGCSTANITSGLGAINNRHDAVIVKVRNVASRAGSARWVKVANHTRTTRTGPTNSSVYQRLRYPLKTDP